MAQVSLRINGYAYMLSCADGEEDHLRVLAADLDRRIDGVKASAGPSGESRLLLMAALMLSDELHDLREQMGDSPGTSFVRSPARAEPKAARRLNRIARRAESIAASAEAARQQETPAAELAADPDPADPRAEDIAAKHERP